MTAPGSVDATDNVVCHINLARGFRGGERQTELLIEGLATLGWRQRLVVRKGSELLPRVRHVNGLQAREVAANPATAALAARGCAAVHAHEGRSLYPAWVSHVVWRTPYLLTRRIDNPFSKSFFRDRAYTQADAVVCVSAAIREIVIESYPSMTCPIIPDAHANFRVDAVQREAIRDQYPGKTLIGHIGALVQRHKGQMSIIETARMMQHSHPHTHFLLLGSGPDEDMMRNSARGLPNVTFTGQVSNVADYLAAFDYFVFPSLMEGLGSTLLDAMHFGLPIVASNVGGIPEIVEDNVNGLLVEPGKSELLAAALERLMSDSDLCHGMAEKNRIKAQDFTAAAMAKFYDSLYRKMLTP